MPKLQKDPQYPNLFQNEQTGVFYFRKYITGKGELTRSLRTTIRSRAIKEMNQLLARWLASKPEEATVTIDTVIEELYEVYQKDAKATFDNFESFCRLHIFPFFSGKDIGDIGKEWELFKAFLKKTRPEMRLGHVRKHLQRILNYSVERGYLEAARKLKLNPGERFRDPVSAYSPEDVQELISKLEDPWRLVISFMIFMGLRPVAIRHLRWSDIDLMRGTVCIGLDKDRRPRLLQIPTEILHDLRIRAVESESEWVFPHRRDKTQPMTRSDKAWQRIKKAIGWQGKLYWFRHTHGTLAVESGRPALSVAKTMGTSVQMLERVYVVPTMADADKRIKSVGEFFERTEPNSQIDAKSNRETPPVFGINSEGEENV